MYLNMIDTRNQICYDSWKSNILKNSTKEKVSLFFAPSQAEEQEIEEQEWDAVARNKQKKPWNMHGNVARLRLMELMKSFKWTCVCVYTLKKEAGGFERFFFYVGWLSRASALTYCCRFLQQILPLFHFCFQSRCSFSPRSFVRYILGCCYSSGSLLLSCFFRIASPHSLPLFLSVCFALCESLCDMRRFWYYTQQFPKCRWHFFN